MKNILKTPEDLIAAGFAAPDQARALEAVAALYSIAIPPGVAALIARPDDPIARQFLPDAAELRTMPGESVDPIGDDVHQASTGLIHRYPDRALLKLTSVCPVYCRFCFRRARVGAGTEGILSDQALDEAFAYLEGRKEIWELIVTGGDPLGVSPRRLADLSRRISAVGHIKILRFHSRVPALAPERIGPELIDALKASGKTVYVALHANHPRELTASAKAACARLVDAGIVMVSQTVLLRGVNDDVETLSQLMRAFVEMRIKPYYLHHPDLAPGTSHFRLGVEEGQALVRGLLGRLSGLCQPTYVVDIPGGYGKAPAGPAYFSRETGGWSVVDWQGKSHAYADLTPQSGKRHFRLDLGRFEPILPGRNESEPQVSRHHLHLMLARAVLVLTLAGAGPAFAVDSQAPQSHAPASPSSPAPPAPPASPSPPAPPASPAPPPAAASPEQPVVTESSGRLDAAKQGLDQIVSALGSEQLSDADLARQAAAIPPIADQIQSVIAEVTPRLAALKARLDQLGPAPDPKANPAPPPEDPGVAQDRRDQSKLYAANDDLFKRANLLQVRAEQMAAHITERRRALFANELFRGSSSIFTPSLWIDVARETPRGLASGRAAFGDLAGHAAAALGGGAGLTFGCLLVLVFMALVAASLVARRVIPREHSRRPPNELQKAAAALWTALAVTAIPVAGAGAIYGLANWFELDAPQMHPLFSAGFAGIIRLALAAGLGAAILAPTRPLWRPLDLTDRVAQRVMTLVMTVAVFVTSGKLVEAMNEVIGASLQATVAARGVFALLVGLALARGLYGIVGHPAEAEDDNDPPAHLEDESPWWPPIRFAAWSATLAILLADVFGYIALSAFLVGQIAWWALVGSLLFLLLKLANEGTEQAFRPNSRFSRGMMASLGLRRESLQQIGVLLSAAITVALATVAVLLLLAPWGLQSQDMKGAVEQAFFGVKIGDVTVSLSGLILALTLFAIGYGLTHATQSWLENRYLPLTGLDEGLRASIRTSVGYLGVFVTIALVFSFLGINTEKLALVAGALSVGIGLGLQSVVNNFVSGLILLWERAIRVGDWVLIGENQGYVRRINVRSTEIETFDRATMIVPNGHMVTDIVKNFVRSDRVGRVQVPVQVIWGSDPEKVREALLDVAKAHEEVVGIPAPTVLFSSFSQTALEFELVCFVEDVEHAARVKSDLHYAIFKSFAESGLRMNPAPAAPPSIALDLAQIEPLLQRFAPKSPGDIKP